MAIMKVLEVAEGKAGAEEAEAVEEGINTEEAMIVAAEVMDVAFAEREDKEITIAMIARLHGALKTEITMLMNGSLCHMLTNAIGFMI